MNTTKVTNKTSHLSHSLSDTTTSMQVLLSELLPVPDRATVLFFVGDLGSGKTTSAQALARELGIKSSVISPTFILEKRYTISKHSYFKTLVHIDAYRFDDPAEAAVLRLGDTLQDPHSLIVIEWPERLGDIVQADIVLEFSTIDEHTRKISW
jgi:tRNA threonylcarbamoyladenosine biosynthesis protein TsaE